MMWRREDCPLLSLCCAQAEESEITDGRLKSQRKGGGDNKKRPSALQRPYWAYKCVQPYLYVYMCPALLK